MTQTPHDALFKAVFSEPAHAAMELRAVLPPALVAATDWSTLTLEPGSYVDDELVERQSDLLFRVVIAEAEARYYVLFEHQSEPDPRMAFRLLRYEVRIWERLEKLEPGRALPAIVPVVLAHSERGWRVPLAFEELLDLGAARTSLLPHVPRFRYLVDDLSNLTDDALARRVLSLYVRAVLALLRDGRRMKVSDVLRRHAALFAALEGATRLEALEILIRYALEVADESEHRDIIDVMSSIESTTRGHAMRSIADKIFEEGEARGLEKGLERGLEKGREKGLRATLRKQLQLKFGALSLEHETRLETAPPELLDRWVERVLTADTIEQALDH